MVVKTELCAFSEFRIYPGHGSNFVRRDGQVVKFITSKAASLYHQRKKPAKITWTQAWRRLNKKGQKDEYTRVRKRRTQKFARAIVGLSVDDFKARRHEKAAVRQANREATIRKLKERKKANREKAKANKAKAQAAAPKASQKMKKGGRKGH